MKKWILIFFVSTVAAAVAACGQTGPLYLPGHTPPSSQTTNQQNVANQVTQNLNAV